MTGVDIYRALRAGAGPTAIRAGSSQSCQRQADTETSENDGSSGRVIGNKMGAVSFTKRRCYDHDITFSKSKAQL